MMQRTYSTLLYACAFVNAVLFSLVIFNVDPKSAGFVGFFLFYSTLYLWLFGFVYGIIMMIYKRFFGAHTAFASVQMVTRQSLLVGALFIGLMILQSFSLLTWYNVILFVVVISLVEYLFVSKKVFYARKSL